MDSLTLLSIAGVITKDPDHNEYPKTVKYDMLSVAQNSIIKLIDSTHLNALKNISVVNATSGSFNLPSDFFEKVSLINTNDNYKEINYISPENLGVLYSDWYGRTNTKPSWYIVRESGTLKAYVTAPDLSGLTSLRLIYIVEPPKLSDSQNPYLIGFESSIILYFKYLFHLTEGQEQLAALAYKSFLDSISKFLKPEFQTQEANQ
jgi:hypothetical protein